MMRTRLVSFGFGFCVTGAAIAQFVWKDLLTERISLTSEVKHKFDALEARISTLESLKIQKESAQAQNGQLKYVQEVAVSGEEPPQKYIQKDIVDVMGKQVTADDSLSLPVIDISRFTPDASIEEKEEEMEKLKSALSSWGMFQAIGHTIPQNLLDNVYKVAKQFFDLPLEEKQKYSVSKDHESSDFQGFGCDSSKPDIADDMVQDWNDFLSLLVEPVEDRNLRYWPGDDFRRTLDEYSVQTRSVSEIILKAMAKSLGLEEHGFIDHLGGRQSVITHINFYPPCARPDLVYGLRPHTDGGAITVLLQDPEAQGLQVHKNEQWVSVPCMPGALLVNLGDQLHIMSNGIFKSPLHRAVTNKERTRISLAMFYAPHIDNEIEPVAGLIDESNPRKYRKVKVKDYLDAFYENYFQGKRVYDWASV